MMPLDNNVIGRITFGRRQTGLPAVQMLRTSLERHLAVPAPRIARKYCCIVRQSVR